MSTHDTPTSRNEELTPSERTILLARISELESQLRTQSAQLASLNGTTHLFSPPSPPARKFKKPPNTFDPSNYHTRRIALKFSYIGTSYNGYEHANNATSAPPKPTIEEVLWKALRKARLISPPISDGADASFEVVWDEKTRAQQYGAGIEGAGKGRKGKERLELNWEGCEYSKCGRTDKGVSAFGQVVGITVRSSRPKKKKDAVNKVGADGAFNVNAPAAEADTDEKLPSMPDWNSIRDEFPYVSVLNSLLPPSIRILAWCPYPPPEWDARFTCRERRYKYFFTNPAFCPTPGPLGLTDSRGQDLRVREGWLDIGAMKAAAKKLEGLHDFRNFCKIDASKQMTSCERRITSAGIEELDLGVNKFVGNSALNTQDTGINGMMTGLARSVVGDIGSDGPKVYAFAVHGTAFLWHQVRCMVAILFLVGQGLEKPEIVDELFDIAKNPGRPHYEMADDAPLVLWDCIFPGEGDFPGTKMDWIYAGDERGLPTATAKGDSKFGVGGIVETLWAEWREAKLKETLTAGLLGLALSQGDGTPLQRGGQVVTTPSKSRSQRLFDGGNVPNLVGDYIPVMQKQKLETLKILNAKYLAGKQARRDAKKGEKDENDQARSSVATV